MAFLQLLTFLLAIAVEISQGATKDGPKVRTLNGVLEGIWRETTNGRQFASFLGVPYARPPVGCYRLREPQPMKPWTGIWNASRVPSRCLQYAPGQGIIGSEDCLFVNILTPKPKSNAFLPVIIHIHGGAYMFGAGGQNTGLMDRDVVVVTMNYRLGPIGFLSTQDDQLPGNVGLKDQSFALKWVRDNIVVFGGNPGSVTLTGLSAGGASMHYHYLSALSRDTYHRGIAFSGAAFTSWSYALKPLEKAKELASIVGCPTGNTRDIAKCLASRPAETLVRAQVEMFDWRVNWFTMFTPTAEPEGTKNAFITQHPYLASQAGDVQPLPLIASVVSEEGLYPAAAYQVDSTILPELEARWEELASDIFQYNDSLPRDQHARVARKIKQEYLGGRPVSQDTFDELVQALGDRLFVSDVGKLAQIHAMRSLQPTYVYRFSYKWQYSLSNLLAQDMNDYGVSHGDDVALVFGILPNNPSRPEDIQMSEDLIDMIYSYAKTGVPKLRNAPKWLKVKPGDKQVVYMEIASPNNKKMKSTSNFGNKSFWDRLGFNETENYPIQDVEKYQAC